MSNYVKENLGPKEKVVMEAKINRLCIVPNIIGLLIGMILIVSLNSAFSKFIDFATSMGEELPPDILIVMVRVMIFAILSPILIVNIINILSRLNSNLVVTNKRVLGKCGVLSIKAIDYPIEKIDNVSLNAGLFGRIFKYYNLSVRTAGDGAVGAAGAVGGIRFSGIKNAVEFKNHVTLAIEQHAEESRKLQAEEIAKAMAKNQ